MYKLDDIKSLPMNEEPGFLKKIISQQFFLYLQSAREPFWAIRDLFKCY